ncbi:MAG: LysR family transcriptional regulator [Thermobacillus sp.]|uniref:LysR family transcriptional regulator n=1 Tax=Thermobacillus sp. TaxID=2108467 RepID=UPI000E3687CC|nr:LysR family transcriptional regulator [Thermobacillus sp.]REK54079.1 MAG: LysR family transcriptional regulator [Thermobacillus sp.]
MNLHALRLFCAVAEAGSVTRAAERLRISQPAVTSQIKKLEAELGLPLLEADGRGVRLTEAGRLLAERAMRLFSLEADIERTLAEYREGKSGSVRIAATWLPANHLLPGPLAAFKAGRDQVELSLTTVNSKAAFELLLRCEADFAVVGGGRPAPAGLACTPFLEDEMLFAAPAGHPLAGRSVPLAEVVRHPFVLREEGSSTREKLLACCRTLNAGLPRVGLTASGPYETLRAVKAGCGIAFVSALEVRDELARGELAVIHVPDVHAVNPIALYTRQDEPLSPAARQCLDHILAVVA